MAIATSWSYPQSACALHTRFGDGNYRGPVRYHLDLDAALDEAKRQVAGASQPLPAAPAQPTDGAAAPKPAEKTAAVPKTAAHKVPGAGNNPSKAALAAKKTSQPRATAASAKTKKTTASRTKTTKPVSPRKGSKRS